MGRTEGIVDIEVAERREVRASSGRSTLRPARKRVFSTRRHGPAWQLARRRDTLRRSGMNSMGAPSSRSRSRTICRSEYLDRVRPWAPQMREDHHARSLFAQIGEGGQGGAQPAVVVTTPSLSGTLKSSRTRARFASKRPPPAGRGDCASSPRASDVRQQVERNAASSPFRCRTTTRRAPACRRSRSWRARPRDTRVEAADIVDRNQRFVRPSRMPLSVPCAAF